MAKIGFIGTGNMGTAIISGLAGKGHELFGTDLNRDKLEELGRKYGLVAKDAPAQVIEQSDVVVLAVKPQQIPDLLKMVGNGLAAEKCLVSIAAGITVKRLRELTEGKCKIVRVMPNTPALIGEGCSAVCFDPESEFDEELQATVRGIFEAVGQVHILPEKDFDAFTAVIGSGPAYVFYFMETAIEAAVNLGLPRPQATEMVNALFTGAAKLAAESEFSASQLREMVTSPAGTTTEALVHMDRTAMRGNFIDAIRACFKRSRELGD